MNTNVNASPQRVMLAAYGAVMLGLGIIILSAPMPMLLDRIMPDDAFYYYQPARNFALTGFSSFDGIHFTNGYQPLWFLVSVPVFWLFPAGGEAPIRLLLVVQIALSVGATVLALRTTARLFGIQAASIAFVIWIVILQRLMLYGLETALLMFLYVLLFDLYGRTLETPKPRLFLAMGIVSGLTFLARTDSAFLVAGISAALVFRAVRGGTPYHASTSHIPVQEERVGDGIKDVLVSLLLFAAPVGLIAGTYLLINLHTTGHLMPVSGAAKQAFSAQVRQAALQEIGNPWKVTLQNFAWVLRSGCRFVLVGLIGPWLLMILSVLRRHTIPLSRVRRYWPFYLGAVVSFLFYGLSFYWAFSRTSWYYAPHTFLACFTIAGLAQTIADELPFQISPGPLAVLLVGLTLGAVSQASWFPVLLALAVLGGLTIVVRQMLPGSVITRAIATVLIIAGPLVPFYFKPTIQIADAWLVLTLAVLSLGSVFRASGFGKARLPYASISVLGVIALLQTWVLWLQATTPPAGWNYHLYKGALWARENLPPDATIWAGSAGILGYFSERTVVNTDGLANDYDFLETVLKAGPDEMDTYRGQWDYAIDAFSYPSGPLFPEGCFVPLPPEYQLQPFFDADLGQFRRLQVFQMKSKGIIICPEGE